jgi:hypothetical protein
MSTPTCKSLQSYQLLQLQRKLKNQQNRLNNTIGKTGWDSRADQNQRQNDMAIAHTDKLVLDTELHEVDLQLRNRKHTLPQEQEGRWHKHQISFKLAKAAVKNEREFELSQLQFNLDREVRTVILQTK